MRLPLFTVDAFAAAPFGGNPAAIVLLPHGSAFDDALLLNVAAENNLSETAFVEPLTASPVKSGETAVVESRMVLQQ